MKYTEIELPFWQNPQFHPYLRYQRDRAIVQVKCYRDVDGVIETDTKLLGQLEFFGVKAIEFNRYSIRSSHQVKAIYKSSFIEFTESPLLSKYYKSIEKYMRQNSPGSLRHYAVTAHDCDINIVARTVEVFSIEMTASDPPWLDE